VALCRTELSCAVRGNGIVYCDCLPVVLQIIEVARLGGEEPVLGKQCEWSRELQRTYPVSVV
jgi:hypothetical protein